MLGILFTQKKGTAFGGNMYIVDGMDQAMILSLNTVSKVTYAN